MFNLRSEVFRSCLITCTSFQVTWGFQIVFTPFRVKIWSSHILLDLLYEEKSSINRAGMVKRLETCLSPSSLFNLFSLSFNHGTLKIIYRKVFPLDVMYRRFLLTHEVIYGEFGAIKCLNLKYALTPLLCQSHRDKCFEIHVFFICHFVL
jgi:hypothetical protein